MSTHYDCIVIGLGGMGSATAYELARRGARVLGLDRHGAAHDYGSSHGRTRIIRKAYFEHPDYVPLLHRAYVKWRELEAATGRRLYEPVGLFLSGPAESTAIAGTLRAAREHRLPLEQLTANEARRRFPGFAFDADSVTLYEQDAGRLSVEECVSSHLEAARQRGADLRFHEPVVRWTEEPRGVRVFTERGIYEAERLIFTSGAWTSGLLRPLAKVLEVRRKVQLWHRSPARDYAASPCFFYEEPEGEFYGLPEPDGEWVKVAEHTGGDAVDDPALVDRALTTSDVERVAAFVERRLPGLDPRALRHSVCLYTMSPDGHFLVDRWPGSERVWLAAGFSGHGFKFAGVIGEALADLSLNGRTDLAVGFLRLGRLASVEGSVQK